MPASAVGGKAASLLRLRAEGFPVPAFDVIPRSVLAQALEGSALELDELVRGIDPREPASLAHVETRAAEIIRTAFLRASFLRQRLREGSFGAGCSLAVRSSAIDEDSAAHSFAGLMDSVLNVRPSGLEAAVLRVWASAYSARALLYRRRKGLDHPIGTAVIVQAMVPSAVSGVLFTRDPLDGSPTFVIAAGLGLGEGVVANTVETDTYRVARGSTRVVRDVKRKETRVASCPEGGTRVEPVPPRQQSRTALSDPQVRELCEVAARIEAFFGAPQDVEWAFDAAGRLSILQSRPIVAAAVGEKRVWDNANVAESYPGLTLPLTFSLARRGYAQTFRRAARGFLPFSDPFRDRPHVFANLIALLDGRVYYNLLNWYEMLSALPAPDRQRASWDGMIGIAQKTAAPPRRIGRLARLGSGLSALAVLLRPGSVGRRFFRRFEAFLGTYGAAGTNEATGEEVVATFRALEAAVGDFWYLTIENDLCAMKYLEWLSALCRRLGLEDLKNPLLSGERSIESVEPLRSLKALARLVRTEPLYAEELARGDDRATWDRIQREEAFAPLRDALEGHRQAFGDRGFEDLKLEAPTFREDPARLIGLIRRCGPLDPAGPRGESEGRPRREAEAAVRSRLPWILTRVAFGLVLGRARLAIRQRENMRLARTRLHGIVRRLFRRLSGLLVHDGLLDAADDVFYLSIEELFDTVEGASITRDLKALVGIRKAEYAAFGAREQAGRLETIGIPSRTPFPRPSAMGDGARSLRGTGCSSGRVEGRALVVTDPERARGRHDQILVARSTDPGWVFLMAASAGLVVERGSPLSHTAIIGRELGIPTVVGVAGAVSIIPDGAALTIDGGTGEVRWA